MFMRKKLVELKEQLRERDDEIRELKNKIAISKEWEEINLEKAKDILRKEMQKSLIESDLRRVEAVAKLETYIEMDTKDERRHIQQMLEEAIKSLGQQKITVNTK